MSQLAFLQSHYITQRNILIQNMALNDPANLEDIINKVSLKPNTFWNTNENLDFV